MSVPSWKMISTTERPWTDLERSTSSRGMPLTAYSMGSVTSCSISLGDRPGASVWMTTCGGANSGKTSRRARRAALTPSSSNSTARASTTTRLWIDQLTTAWSMLIVVAGAPELLGQQHLRPADDNLVAVVQVLRVGGEDPAVRLEVETEHLHLAAGEADALR